MNPFLNVPARPRPVATTIDRVPGKMLLIIRSPFSPQNVAACKGLPDFRSYLPQERAWVCRPSPANIEALQRSFAAATWTEAALLITEHARSVSTMAARQLAHKAQLTLIEAPVARDYAFHTTPFAHQARAFLLSRDLPAFGLFMEQGTGKTKVAIDSVAWQHLHHGVTGLLVVCPNGVKSTWAEEIETHLPPAIRREVRIHESAANAKTRAALEDWASSLPTGGGLEVLIMNVEALVTDRGQKLARDFLSLRVCSMNVDESSTIKTPSAKRTKAVCKLGKLAKFRRIMTGTPVTQSPLDVYAQVKFLDENILGFSSFYAFRNRYALLGGWNAREIIGFAHLDELQAKLAPFTFRVLKEECLDLPPKMYVYEDVDLTEEQQALYSSMKEHMISVVEYDETTNEGKQASVTIVLTQMMRLQQIVGGFIQVDGEDHPRVINGPNPKICALLDIVDRTPGKLVIWSRFVPEIELIVETLSDVWGPETVVAFYGGVDNEERTRGRRAFQDPDSPVRFFVGNPSAGGKGLTLTAAHTCVYFSNDFSLENRLQTEDRLHRIGQTGDPVDNRVLYIDLRARKTIDKKVIAALREKKNLADLVTGDALREWINA